jgi:hypothetical protein
MMDVQNGAGIIEELKNQEVALTTENMKGRNQMKRNSHNDALDIINIAVPKGGQRQTRHNNFELN